MPSLNNIKDVIKKIISIDEISEHICLFGGSIPYIYFNRESNREHSDIDVLVEEGHIDVIRNLVQQNKLYSPELDSINLGLDDDYGLKVFIDGVYVEFEPMNVKDNIFTRKSFSPNREVAGIEQIPYSRLDDLITEIDVDGIKTFCQSIEMIKVGKEQYKREKDLMDIKFIENQGFDKEKYERVKKSVEMSSTFISNYEDLRERKIR